MKPSKGSWNGEFRGFRICVGWISTTRFCVVDFMCPNNISLFCVCCVSILCLFSLFRLPRQGLPRPIYTARAITPLPPLHGYHAIVLSSIPRLPHLSYHAPPHNTYIGLSHPPYVVVCSLPFTGYEATSSSPPTPPPGRHTYQPTPHKNPAVQRGGECYKA